MTFAAVYRASYAGYRRKFFFSYPTI